MSYSVTTEKLLEVTRALTGCSSFLLSNEYSSPLVCLPVTSLPARSSVTTSDFTYLILKCYLNTHCNPNSGLSLTLNPTDDINTNHNPNAGLSLATE